MPSVLAESAQIALPKLQPTTEETTPDPHPITDSLLVTTTKLSPITVNHHQPKPRMPSVLAESAQIALPKLQPTTEETTPDPHPITDSLLVTTTKLSPITVNHHQPKPRMPSVLAESAQIALPKLQPTTEETTPDPHPITDSLLVTTTKLSPITVNHHQPKPRMPSVLAESAQIGPLHLKTLPDMEFRSQRPPPNL
jgi:hypothetical protein